MDYILSFFYGSPATPKASEQDAQPEPEQVAKKTISFKAHFMHKNQRRNYKKWVNYTQSNHISMVVEEGSNIGWPKTYLITVETTDAGLEQLRKMMWYKGEEKESVVA
jgi:hypothetical protein